MKLRKHILLLVFLGILANTGAQFDPNSISRVESGKLIYRLDFRWSDEQKNEVEKLFNLDSTIWQIISQNTANVLLDSVSWDVKHNTESIIELSKKIENLPVFHFDKNDIFLVDDKWFVAPGYVDMGKIIYGANNLKIEQCFQYEDGIARFFLPGFSSAEKAFIAGSFNKWNPSATSMKKIESGWIVEIPLTPGKYFYKFIIDGKWMKDPNNELNEDDGQGNINSVVYCPNFQFHLKRYEEAKKVVVAGTFNNWNQKELKMQRVDGGWLLPLYLKEGTYSYKFLVDTDWIIDPENPKTRIDGKGNKNSVMGTGEEFIFRLNGFTNAENVFIAGNFNNWDRSELRMEKTAGGWELEYQLAPGNYEYKFIVDGEWMTDPANPYTIGKGNYVNSTLAYKANYTFSLDEFPGAGDVRIAGSFNNWNPEGYKMVKKDGIWIFPIYLSQGKHLYKLIVDGKWIIDPGNKLWEDNEYGTGNSIVWMR